MTSNNVQILRNKTLIRRYIALGCTQPAYAGARALHSTKPALRTPSAAATDSPIKGVLLAKTFDVAKNKPDPSGWWMSEKLDGMRVVWDGQGGLWTRNGKPIYAPDWWLRSLPVGMPLDGEAWTGRGEFSRTISIVRSYASPDWNQVRFCAIDALRDPNLSFEDRRRQLISEFGGKLEDDDILMRTPLSPAQAGHVVSVVPHRRCTGRDNLLMVQEKVIAVGGEGVMIRQPGSTYVFKRSSSLLKLKQFKDDEARVLGTVPGEGRYAGMVGSLLCETRTGVRFAVGSGLNDADRVLGSPSLPSVGSIVTYRYFEMSKDGVPRFPTLVGEAIDRDWP